jgi:hypothetical protein
MQIMMYGYPVETLCVYQYSLVSLMPGEPVMVLVDTRTSCIFADCWITIAGQNGQGRSTDIVPFE